MYSFLVWIPCNRGLVKSMFDTKYTLFEKRLVPRDRDGHQKLNAALIEGVWGAPSNLIPLVVCGCREIGTFVTIYSTASPFYYFFQFLYTQNLKKQ